MLQGFSRLAHHYGLKSTVAAYGSRLYCSVAPQARWRVMPVTLKGVEHSILLRPGTTDWRVMHQVFVEDEYDAASEPHDGALSQFYQDVLGRSEVPIIIDCGANIGTASIWYALRYPRARIIAVEPEPENFRILCLNAKNYPNITPVQGGISDRQTRVSLTNVSDAPWAWQTEENDDGGDIATFTIASLLDTVPKGRLMIVKIDIEGAETDLFRSNLDWHRQTPLIVFESHDRLFAWRGTFHAIVKVLADQSRDYIQKGENTFAFSHNLISGDSAGTRNEAREPIDHVSAS